jgi:hypothetical protein
LIKEITEGDGLPVTISGANTGSIFGHPMTPALSPPAPSVPAIRRPSASIPRCESFSSSGAGTELLFANDGTVFA